MEYSPRKNKIWLSVFRNVVSGFGGTITILLVNFALMPFVINSIGQTDFGIWVLANSLVGYLGILDVGLQPTLIKKSSEYLASSNRKGLSTIVNTTLFIYTIIGSIIGIIVVALISVFPLIFDNSSSNIIELKSILLIIGIQIALSFPMSLWRGLVGGLQDYHVINIVTVVSNLAKAFITYLLILFGYGIVALIWLGLAINMIVWLVSYLWVKYRIPYLRLLVRDIRTNEIRELTRFSGSMFIWGVASQALNELDKILIGIFLPIANITLYEVGFRIYNYSRIIQNSIISILPTASDLSAKNENTILRSLYLNSTKYVFVSYLMIVSILLIFGEEFINLWMGDEYKESVIVMQILLIGSLFQSQNVVAHVILPGMNKLRVFTSIMASYPIVKIILGVILLINYGLKGIALATTLTYIILEAIFLTYILDIFQVSKKELINKIHLPAIMTVVPGVIFGVCVQYIIIIQTWSYLIISIMFICTIFMISFVILGMTKIERQYILAGVERIVHKKFRRLWRGDID